jgi:hypothetical protein
MGVLSLFMAFKQLHRRLPLVVALTFYGVREE